MDWRQLLRDRRLQIGVAAAAAVGLVVFLKRRNAGGGSDVTGNAAVAGGGVGNPAGLNTTGTDLSAVWGNMSADLQGQLNDFAGQINDALKNIPGSSPTPSPVPLPKPVPKPTPGTRTIPELNPRYRPGTGWAWVRRGDSLASFAAKNGITLAQLKALNSANALNRLTVGEALRVRGAAGPKPPGSKA